MPNASNRTCGDDMSRGNYEPLTAHDTISNMTRRELLAVDSVKSFHHYLYGQKFIIRSDHTSLRWLMSFKDLEGQLARWLERLQQYDFEVIYQKGNLHKNADDLSGCPCAETTCNYCTRVEAKEEKLISRIIFGIDNYREWRAKHLEDPIV